MNDKSVMDIAGNIAMPGFTAPKVLWLKNNEFENFKLIHKVLLPKDYLRFYLTGEFFSDLSDASGFDATADAADSMPRADLHMVRPLKKEPAVAQLANVQQEKPLPAFLTNLSKS